MSAKKPLEINCVMPAEPPAARDVLMALFGMTVEQFADKIAKNPDMVKQGVTDK